MRDASAIKQKLNTLSLILATVLLRAKILLRSWDARVSLNWRAKMNKLISRFVRDESGATAIEYGLIAALIAVVIITALTTVGTNLNATFTSRRRLRCG